MDPDQGRFTTRDSIGIWGDFSNLGNGYTYVGNNPLSFLDPFGLQDKTIPFSVSDRYPSDPQINPGNASSPDTQQDFTGWQNTAEQAFIWTEYFVIPTADQGGQVINTPYAAFRGGVDLATNEDPGFWDWLGAIPFFGRWDDGADACNVACRNADNLPRYGVGAARRNSDEFGKLNYPILGATGTGTDLRRNYNVSNNDVIMNTGHGYFRPHSGPNGITDLRTSGYTVDEIEQSILADIALQLNNGFCFPNPQNAGFSTPFIGNITIGNFNLSYRATRPNDGKIRVATYYGL